MTEFDPRFHDPNFDPLSDIEMLKEELGKCQHNVNELIRAYSALNENYMILKRENMRILGDIHKIKQVLTR